MRIKNQIVSTKKSIVKQDKKCDTRLYHSRTCTMHIPLFIIYNIKY